MSRDNPAPTLHTIEDPARQAAYDVLIQVDQRLRRRTLKLDALMEDIRQEYAAKTHWGPQEQSLFYILVVGVMQHWWYLEWIMAKTSKFELRRLSGPTRTILRMGLYQLRCLEDIPEYASVATVMRIAQLRKVAQKTVNFINGVLRQHQRDMASGDFQFPSLEEDPYGYLMSEGGLPRWWARRLMDQYPIDAIVELATAQRTPVPLSIRVNTLLTTVEAVKQALDDAEVGYHQPFPDSIPEVLLLKRWHGQPTQLPGYTQGWIYIQEVSSGRVAPFINPQPEEIVVDLCAAPGSKTTHMAALMANTGTLLAVDSKPTRLQTLTENLNRLGVTNTQAVAADGKTVSRADLGIPEGADRVLVDAPCSGLGTVRKHPDIALNLTEKRMASFPPDQIALVENALKLVKPGGVLVYSTCSVDESENEAVVKEVLKHHPNLTLEAEEKYLPHVSETAHWDGFYMAKLKKALPEL